MKKKKHCLYIALVPVFSCVLCVRAECGAVIRNMALAEMRLELALKKRELDAWDLACLTPREVIKGRFNADIEVVGRIPLRDANGKKMSLDARKAIPGEWRMQAERRAAYQFQLMQDPVFHAALRMEVALLRSLCARE